MQMRRFKKGSTAIYTLNEAVTKEEAMRAINEIEKFERDSKFATIKAQKEVEK